MADKSAGTNTSAVVRSIDPAPGAGDPFTGKPVAPDQKGDGWVRECSGKPVAPDQKGDGWVRGADSADAKS
jgi:hypothetical protein